MAIGVTLFPFIILKEKVEDYVINHERIHLRQQLEMLVIPFYIWYMVECYIKGYNNVSFEKEAYDNDENLDYLKERKWYSWIKYIKKNNSYYE